MVICLLLEAVAGPQEDQMDGSIMYRCRLYCSLSPGRDGSPCLSCVVQSHKTYRCHHTMPILLACGLTRSNPKMTHSTQRCRNPESRRLCFVIFHNPSSHDHHLGLPRPTSAYLLIFRAQFLPPPVQAQHIQIQHLSRANDRITSLLASHTSLLTQSSSAVRPFPPRL